MKISRLIAIAVIAAGVGGVIGVSGSQAQIKEQQPAEFPPRSYNGKQYVDSKGCVFIRAGIDGDVSWVPRVNRKRQIVCGFKPTGLGQVATAPATQPVDEAVRITLNPPTAAVPTPRPVPQKATPQPVTAPVVLRQTAPKPIRKTPVQPRLVQAPVPLSVPIQPVPTVRAASVSRTASSGGSQAAAPEVSVTAQTRIVPKHVAVRRLNTRNVQVPKGYRAVWDDDRLNPYRAEQNLAGRADMLLIWSQTVPRRLINQANGRDVTATVPLVYPYLDIATQRRELGEVEIMRRDGKVVKRVIRNTPRPARRAVYSSRSTPKATVPASANQGQRYVQVGSFRDPGNAQRSARQIAAMGLPARIGKQRSGANTLMVVQAGPFTQSDALQAALGKLRRAGYKDAFARK